MTDDTKLKQLAFELGKKAFIEKKERSSLVDPEFKKHFDITKSEIVKKYSIEWLKGYDEQSKKGKLMNSKKQWSVDEIDMMKNALSTKAK